MVYNKLLLTNCILLTPVEHIAYKYQYNVTIIHLISL